MAITIAISLECDRCNTSLNNLREFVRAKFVIFDGQHKDPAEEIERQLCIDCAARLNVHFIHDLSIDNYFEHCQDEDWEKYNELMYEKSIERRTNVRKIVQLL